MSTYGPHIEDEDDYLRIDETIILKCVDEFRRDAIDMFGVEYLRRPNTEDIEHLLHMGKIHGFPVM